MKVKRRYLLTACGEVETAERFDLGARINYSTLRKLFFILFAVNFQFMFINLDRLPVPMKIKTLVKSPE